MNLPKFYPIFDSSDWLVKLLPLGIKLVQIRIKETDDINKIKTSKNYDIITTKDKI